MGKKVRTKAACDILGCCPNTLRRWTEEGKFKVYRSGKSGNRRWDEDDLRRYLGEKVDEPEVETKNGTRVVIYCRVSTSDQKSHGDLDRQKLRLMEYCVGKKYSVVEIFEEVGSGLNDNRKKLLRMMRLAAEHKFDKVVIEHYDRLTRFNYNLLVEYFRSHGVDVEYTESVLSESFEADLVKDMLSLLAVFSAKLYSRRGKENRKKRKEAKVKQTNDKEQ